MKGPTQSSKKHYVSLITAVKVIFRVNMALTFILLPSIPSPTVIKPL